MTRPGRVFLIGAGPGDPGLISARGIRLLADADVVVYDRAVEGVLRWARADAERIEAGAPAEQGRAQDAISMLVAEKARDGHTVARLKWGDAFVFDGGGPEALFLHEQGVTFEVVPGIPAAIGVPAYAGVPVTYPGFGDSLLLIRGNEGATEAPPDVNWTAAASLEGTVVCYAVGQQITNILRALLEHGAPPDRPAAIIYRGSHPGQQTMAGTIAEMADLAAASADSEPGVVVVGQVVSLRDHLRWFDARPLFGRRIVITRSAEQAREIVDMLENLGAEAIVAPTFRLTAPEDPEALDRAASSAGGCAWIVFETATAVTRFLAAIARGPHDLRALGGVLVCAIGASTAERLEAGGIKPDAIVPEFRVDHVMEALDAKGLAAGQRVLVIRPDHPRGVLAEALAERGVHVTDLVAYGIAQESSETPGAQAIYRMLLDGRVDAVTFTSPTAVRLFAALIGVEQVADLLRSTEVAAIGPVTAASAHELGITATIVPDTYTVEGLVREIVQKLGVKGGT